MELKDIIHSLLSYGKTVDDIAEWLPEVCSNGDLEPACQLLHEIANSSKEMKVTDTVRRWVESTTGWFDTNQLDKEIGIITPQQKATRRYAMKQLKDEGLIELHHVQTGKYRFIDRLADKIDWRNADTSKRYDLNWVFPIQQYCYLMPGNIAVVAGASNAGKTALLLDFALRNSDKYQIKYFSSEMPDTEVRGRLEMFESKGIAQLDDWDCIDFQERSHDFQDVIDRDCINIIDFLEVHDEFWRIGEFMKKIYDILNPGDGTHRGIAIVAIQKDKDKFYGLGGSKGLDKARLYLTVDANKITIIKGKNRVNPSVNPDGKTWTFTDIWGGCEFIGIREEQ